MPLSSVEYLRHVCIDCASGSGRQGACDVNGTNRSKAIEEMVRRLVERFDPDQIILFGSEARGTADAGSDVDLLVVMPVSGSKRAKRIELRLALYDIPVPKDIVLVTPEELDRERNVPGTLVRPALAEGKVVYARSG